ncbi:MAG TPA: hypothetical protein VGN09_18845 [Vicinamibacteria bacterium]|jgi:hypothetical protein
MHHAFKGREGENMKAWGWVALISILGAPVDAESLGDAAKRERERREKKKQDTAEIRVIHDEDLLAGRSTDSKGTFSPAAPLARSSSPSSGSGGVITEVDAIRSAARQRLESSYATIAETAGSLGQAVQEYQGCGELPTRRCMSLLITIGNLAMSVGARMEDAEEAARQGWLNPGDVRAVRQRYGMDDSAWDNLVRLVHQYRR